MWDKALNSFEVTKRWATPFGLRLLTAASPIPFSNPLTVRTRLSSPVSEEADPAQVGLSLVRHTFIYTCYFGARTNSISP
ncbi:MAG: hypothetical protein LZF60_230078 [Nitrospira sp.]|nr:MAG: hypothetical protein LZF60_230078 [Nitrospira sp.]